MTESDDKRNLSADTQYSTAALHRSAYVNKRMTLCALFMSLNVTFVVAVIASARFIEGLGSIGMILFAILGQLACYQWATMNRRLNEWIGFYTRKLILIETRSQEGKTIKIFSDPDFHTETIREGFKEDLKALIKNITRLWQWGLGVIVIAIILVATIPNSTETKQSMLGLPMQAEESNHGT